MENEKIEITEITYSVYCADRDGVRDNDGKLGEFSGIEKLNEWILSSGPDKAHKGKRMILHISGLADGRFPFWEDISPFDFSKPIDEGKRDAIWKKTVDSAVSQREYKMGWEVDVEDILFHLILEVKSADDSLVFEGEFQNIYRVNEHILRTKDLPEYKDVKATIWPAEMIDDILEEPTYGYCLKNYDEISYEVEQDIERFISENIEERENTQNHVYSPLYPDLYSEPEDYHKKESLRSEYTYICPFCLNEIDDCRCESYPWTTVQIDTLLLPVIQELNWKGYRTAHCCIGHHPGERTYIAFQHDYILTQVPEGFYYSNSTFNLFRPCPEGLTEEEYQAFRRENAEALLKWAEDLRINYFHSEGY